MSLDKEKRKAVIIARARRVYDISFDYHLTHAVFGSDALLTDDRRNLVAAEETELKKAFEKAAEEGDSAKLEKLKIEKKALEGSPRENYHILIDYSPGIKDLYAGRVIKDKENRLRITLPKKNLIGIKNSAGQLCIEPIERRRGKMAHELGHIVLHTDKFITGAMGEPDNLKAVDWEAELFAEELLRLFKQKVDTVKCEDQATDQQSL
jgi:hypothetical protein